MAGNRPGRQPYGPDTTAPITELQRAMLRAIRSYTQEHSYAPTIREIGAAVGVTSTGQISYNLGLLIARDLVTQDRAEYLAGTNTPREGTVKSRTIRLTPAGNREALRGTGTPEGETTPGLLPSPIPFADWQRDKTVDAVLTDLERDLRWALYLYGLPDPIWHYHYYYGRKWEADAAYPEQRLLIECEGGIVPFRDASGELVKGNSHSSIKGVLEDMDKYNHMTIAGWGLVRCARPTIDSGLAVATIGDALAVAAIPVDRLWVI